MLLLATSRGVRASLVTTILILATAAPAVADSQPRHSRYFFGMGFMVRKAPSELGTATPTPYVARSIESPRGTAYDHDVGMRWRIGLTLGPVAYAAVDVGLGVTAVPEGEVPAAPFEMASSATTLGVAGLRGNAASSTFGVELAAGFRHVTYCIGESEERHDVYTAAQKVAELRVRGERWLGHSAMFGVTLGTSLLDRGAWIGSFDFTFRPRPMR